MKTAQLKELARLEGIQTEYNSAFGTTLQAAPEGLVHVLNALEIPVSEDLDNVEQLLDREISGKAAKITEPSVVCWQGKKAVLPIRIPASQRESKAELRIQLENGKKFKTPVKLAKLPVKSRSLVRGASSAAWRSMIRFRARGKV